MSENNQGGLTRRSFVQGAAIGAAGLAAATPALEADTPPAASPPKLSKVNTAQMEALLAGPGARFTKEEKADVVRLLAAAEKTGATLHGFALQENSDPAVIFRAYRKEGK
jgi:hypothetical protein